MQQRRYPAAEYERIEGQPLSPIRLAAIWKGLQESERFGFILSLDEQLADEVMAATVKLAAPATVPAERNRPNANTR
jgi:hypothetical protein